DGWRRRWYIIIFEAETRAGRRFDEILLLAIVASVAVVMLDSLPSVHDRAGALFTVLEWLFTLLFTAEYAMRILVVRKPLRYVLSFYGVIDFV
ncbi:ion transporter, partial [Chromohalobacter sp. HP20-39]